MSAHSKRYWRNPSLWGVDVSRPHLGRIPVVTAAPAFLFATLCVLYADLLIESGFWMGPIYLALAILCAWFVGATWAASLGILVITIKYLGNHGAFHVYGVHSNDAGLVVRFVCMMAIVSIIGMARRSLESEWRLARTDPLTGAMNRQAFFERFERKATDKAPCILVFADIDGLKRLNDRLGHALGDNALLNFADGVRAVIGKDDLFARIGGDEFVLFMKMKNESAAHAAPAVLNAALNGGAGTSDLTLKCSLGILILPEGSRSIDAELRLADQLMYQAKQAGCGIAVATLDNGDGEDACAPLSILSSKARPGSVLRGASRAPGAAAMPPSVRPVTVRAA